jgi:hydroxyacylglutathione hydrolase
MLLRQIVDDKLTQYAFLIGCQQTGTDVEEAVRSLVRIGFDGITGWVPFEAMCSSGLPLGHIESVDFAEYERRRQHAPVATLDVRSAAEYRTRHIPDAINIPYTRLRVRLSEVPNEAPLFVHCGSGVRAAAAAAYLSGLGRSVVHVDGSLSTWEPEDHRPL